MGRVAGVTAAVVLAMLMLASALPLMASTAAAEGETIPLYVWDGEGATELASEAANWYQDIGGVIVNDVLPTNNSHVRYDATSVKSCTWDLAYPQFVAYSLTLATGYTGTLTQGDVDIGIGEGGFEQESGVFTANRDRSIVLGLNANLTKTGGTFTADRAMLIASGGNTIIGEPGLRSLTINGVVQCESSFTIYRYLYVDVVGVLNIGSSGSITLLSYYIPSPFVNLGTINGPGKLSIWFYDQDKNFVFGNISAPVELILVGGAVSSCKYILPADTILGSSLCITAWDTSKTMTLDLNGHSLTANGIIVATRGAIIGDGIIINAGDFDASAGSFGFTGQYVQADDGTITLGAGQSLPNMTVASQGLSTKWSMQMTGAQPYNVTDLLPGKEYAYYEDDVLLRTYIPDENGTVAMTAVGDGTLVSYEIRLNPVITPVPLDSSTHSRHEVDEGVEYRVQYLSDRHVIWSIEGAPFLTIDESGVITGTPGITDSGQYLVTVTAFNGVGWSSVSFILVVNDSLKPVTDEISGMFGLAISLLVVISIVGALMAAIRTLKF